MVETEAPLQGTYNLEPAVIRASPEYSERIPSISEGVDEEISKG